MLRLDEGLKQFATERQIEFIDACNKEGSYRQAGRVLGVNESVVRKSIKSLIGRGEKRGFSPEHDMTRMVPESFKVKGVSTCYNADGEVSQQWVKSTLDDDKFQQLMLETVEALKEDIPRLSALPSPTLTLNDLCNCYVITDYHMGMLSWHEETGADWDLKISEEAIIKWFEQAIAQSPASKYAVFAQLSDFLHFDGMDAVTPASKHLLDVDGRFSKVVRTAIRVLRRIIDMLLLKHEFLHILMLDANHDPVSQIWLREWISVLYENEPRVTVDTSPSPYNAYEFGKVALFFHHGHKRKVTNVAEVFVAQFRELFGRTKYAYAHTGHLHHLDVKENNMMIVEQHRTIAPADAYSARGGWITGRDAKVITYHRNFGEVSRLTINSDMLQ